MTLYMCDRDSHGLILFHQHYHVLTLQKATQKVFSAFSKQ